MIFLSHTVRIFILMHSLAISVPTITEGTSPPTITEATFPPTITEATFQELPDNVGLVYECVAEGSPLPDITWSVLNFNSGSRQQLENSIPGIAISDMMNPTDTMSRLRISNGAPFEEPICAAENGVSTVTEDTFRETGK